MRPVLVSSCRLVVCVLECVGEPVTLDFGDSVVAGVCMGILD